MQQERKREAAQIEAEGAEVAEGIRARADREATVIKAEATREADILKGEGDAEKTRILGEAYGQDPDFFAFYRSLEAYQDALRAATRRRCSRPTASSSAISRPVPAPPRTRRANAEGLPAQDTPCDQRTRQAHQRHAQCEEHKQERRRGFVAAEGVDPRAQRAGGKARDGAR